MCVTSPQQFAPLHGAVWSGAWRESSVSALERRVGVATTGRPDSQSDTGVDSARVVGGHRGEGGLSAEHAAELAELLFTRQVSLESEEGTTGARSWGHRLAKVSFNQVSSRLRYELKWCLFERPQERLSDRRDHRFADIAQRRVWYLPVAVTLYSE